VKKILLLIALFLLIWPTLSFSKNFNFSITPQVGYTLGTWGKGSLPSPTGEMTKGSVIYGGTAQVVYNRWKFKPTAEFQWDSMRFDFETLQAPSQNARQNIYSGRLGFTYDLDLFCVYLTAGLSWSHTDGRLTEIIDGRVFPHGNGAIPINERGFSVHLGGYKAWNIYGVKVGPEISVEIFPSALGFHRCRNFVSGHFMTHIGLRIQF